ncbi:hypothetical protein V8E36_005195 [Tilletia maclaganii]
MLCRIASSYHHHVHLSTGSTSTSSPSFAALIIPLTESCNHLPTRIPLDRLAVCRRNRDHHGSQKSSMSSSRNSIHSVGRFASVSPTDLRPGISTSPIGTCSARAPTAPSFQRGTPRGSMRMTIGTAVDELITLAIDDFPGVPRVEASVISEWSAPMHRSNVWQVDIQLSPGAEPMKAIFKTYRLPDNPKLSSWTVKRRTESQHYMRSELEGLTAAPPHPNVRPAPLALVIAHMKGEVEHGGQETESCRSRQQTKLIGWLSETFFCTERYIGGPNTAARANRVHGFALDICRGLQNLATHGLYHSGLKLDNTLVRRVDNEGGDLPLPARHDDRSRGQGHLRAARWRECTRSSGQVARLLRQT